MAAPGHFVAKGSAYPRWFIPFTALSGLLGLASGFAAYDGLAVSHNQNLGIGGALAAAALVASVLVVHTRTRREIRVDNEGMEERRGGKVTRIKWSEPHEFFYLEFSDTQTPAVEKARLKTSDGREIEVVDIHLPEQPNIKLPKLVEQYSTTANWPKIQTRIKNGEDVQFGLISVNQDRIRIGEIEYPMKGSVCLQIEKGQLQVGADRKWEASGLALKEIANYSCLLRAVGQVTQARAPV